MKSFSLGSNPSSGTMATIFKYKETIYQCMSLDKKLKRLKISREDIDILFEGELSSSDLEKKYLEYKNVKKETQEDDNEVRLYYFLNTKTGESISSIYPELDPSYVKNVDDYERCTKNDLERNWNKAR